MGWYKIASSHATRSIGLVLSAVILTFLVRNIRDDMKVRRKVDNAPPCVSIETSSFNNNISLLVGASDHKANCNGTIRSGFNEGLDYVVLKQNGSSILRTRVDNSIDAFYKAISLDGVEPGEHRFYLEASDRAGNVNNMEAVVNVDKERRRETVLEKMPRHASGTTRECPKGINFEVEYRTFPEVVVKYDVSGGHPDYVTFHFRGEEKRRNDDGLRSGLFFVRHTAGKVKYGLKVVASGCRDLYTDNWVYARLEVIDQAQTNQAKD